MSVRSTFFLLSFLVLGAIGAGAYFWRPTLWALVLVGPLFLIGLRDVLQKRQTIKRNFPLVGNLRYLLEAVRPEIMQYFVETDTQGRPINRMSRSLVYQRSKRVTDTVPFGTQLDVYDVGYEWMDHSMYAVKPDEAEKDTRVTIGGPDCKQPYSASIYNVSAMSYGSLSKNAVLALNKAAKKGNFFHNTGEGGVSPFHLEPGGDLTWQIGTGYFGCRTPDGHFDEAKFAECVKAPSIKMVEIKLSQGAKPGHGGILPAKKNTEEIAKIRGVQPHTDVHSPPTHSSFSTPQGLMEFIQLLRDKSGGKPIGFKLCIGKKQEFTDLCEAMLSTGIKPDFISVDGGEGGTGAAPVEFSNSLGMPLRDGLAFAYNTLVGYGLKKDIKLIASGKILNGFDIVRAIAIGADLTQSARAMMLSLGCIQALLCNTNTCPVGVATQNKSLMKGLDVPDKAERVANFHHEMIKAYLELVTAAGVKDTEGVTRMHINRRMSTSTVMRYDEIYPYIKEGSLLPAGADA